MVAYSFKRRFIVPIQIGLGLSYALDDVVDIRTDKPKRQTIRASGRKRHAREGEVVQLYYAQRSPQNCRKLGDARCVGIDKIIIWPDGMAAMRNGLIMTARQLTKFARADGFADVYDMQDFWLKEHGPEKFEGLVIRWEPLA